MPQGRLRVLVAGTGPAVVLLHGFGLDARLFERQLTTLAGDHQVIVPELRGYGASSLPQAPYAHHEDLAAVLDALRVETACVLGLSLGASVAASLAVHVPARVRALVSVSPLLRGCAAPELMALLKNVWQVAAEGGVAAARAAWAQCPLFATTRAQPAAWRSVETMLADYHGWHWLHRDPERGLTPPVAQRLGEIRCPALTLTGALDLPDFHAMAEHLVRTVPDAQGLVLPGAGHLPNLEMPEAFDAALADFLERRGAGG